jgi:hypothetical protein
MPTNTSRCANHTGAGPPTGIGEPQYFCYLPIYEPPSNGTNGTANDDGGQSPFEIIRQCCDRPSRNLELYGADNCQAFCVANDEDDFNGLRSCLRVKSEGLPGGFGCEQESAAAPRDVGLGWGRWIVVGLVLSGVLGM